METTVIERPIPSGEGLTFEKVWAMFQETDRKMQETDRKMQETDRKIGELGNRFGELAEHLVAPSIKEKFNEMGYIFTKIANDCEFDDPADPENSAEVDILLENGDVVMAVEVKAKVKQKDVEEHIQRMGKLRCHADRKKDTRRYQGAIAGAIMGNEVRGYILAKGMYAIEQTGDTVRINAPKGFKAREW